MHISGHLVQGVDVWINTPRRPWEASGTSGMKVLVNGGINLSELDGWWAEAYTPEVGWAIGDGNEHGDDPAWDAIEAEQLYSLLEQEIIPEFYNRNEKGIPTAWIARMRESMAQLTPRFSADRSVREYTEQHYLPAAKAYRERSADNGKIGKQIADWQRSLDENWNSMHFGEMKSVTNNTQHQFEVQLFFNFVDPEAIQVQLFANAQDGEAPIMLPMIRGKKIEGPNNGYIYKVKVPSTRSETDYTARVIPKYEGVSVPLEINHILWQR